MFHYLITRPLGFIIEQIYNLVQNYGLAIILFTVIVKLILLPLNVKSQRAMKKQQKIQPIIAQLQAKYKNDQEKLQREMMKVYKDNNVSMMGGCLPMLIQMPILIGLYQVIQRPITYLAGVSEWTQDKLQIVGNLRDKIAASFPDLLGNYATMDLENVVKTGQIEISNWCAKLGEQMEWVFNFDFLGLDLSNKPSAALSRIMAGDYSDMGIVMLILIPVFAVLTTWLSSKIMQMQNKAANSAAAEQTTQMTNTMNIMMPLMTGYFTFILPTGMGLYWIISSVMQIVQQVALNYYFDKKGDDFDVKLPEKNSNKRKKH